MSTRSDSDEAEIDLEEASDPSESEEDEVESSFVNLTGSSQLRNKGKGRAVDELDDLADGSDLLSSPAAKRKRNDASESAESEEDGSRNDSKRIRIEADTAESEDIGSEESEDRSEDDEMPNRNGVRFAEPADEDSSDNEEEDLGFGSDDGAPTNQAGAVQSKGSAMLGAAASRPLLGTSSRTSAQDELASDSD